MASSRWSEAWCWVRFHSMRSVRCEPQRFRLFEELVERGPRVFYFSNRRRRLALNGFAGLKKGTLIAQFLLWDALGYRFPALKSGTWIEANAVLAGVQIAVTLWTLSVKRNTVNLNIDHRSA